MGSTAPPLGGAHTSSTWQHAAPKGLPRSPKGFGAAERNEARREFCTLRLQAAPSERKKLRTGYQNRRFWSLGITETPNELRQLAGAPEGRDLSEGRRPERALLPRAASSGAPRAENHEPRPGPGPRSAQGVPGSER